MEPASDENNFGSIVDTLFGMFGELISKDVIMSVVTSCGGALDEAANTIMNMMEESEITSNSVDSRYTEQPCQNSTLQTNIDTLSGANQPIHFSFSSSKLDIAETPLEKDDAVSSYANASRTGAIPKQITMAAKNIPSSSTKVVNAQFEQIITYHKQGARTLVIMRGLPGSGKSYLAKKIIDAIFNQNSQQNYGIHILCTDDYFMYRGVYRYDRSRIPDAHDWNQRRAQEAMLKGISPVIIDNTNIEIWEMEPYVRWGVQYGYIIEVLEPNTPWAKKKYELCRRNIHNVPLISIERKLEMYVGNITGSYLKKHFGFSYKADMKPPVKREFPPVEENNLDSSDETLQEQNNFPENIKSEHQPVDEEAMRQVAPLVDLSLEAEQNTNEIPFTNTEKNNLEEQSIQNQYEEIKKTLEEFEKVENEWDNGEDWEETKTKSNNITAIEVPNTDIVIKPQRTTKGAKFTTTENLLTSVNAVQDWTKISMFMPDLCENIPLPKEEEKPYVEKISSSTCIESSDTDIYSLKNPLKVITATPRDINEYYLGSRNPKIPGMWMLDKSTSTNEQTTTDTGIFRCQNEEKHFNAFRKLFKSVPKSDLRDIFEKCHGDVNWAVDIVLDSMTNRVLKITENEDFSDSENESNEQCECLAAYNIIPNSQSIPSTIIENKPVDIETGPSPQIKKGKKEIAISEASMQLKRQIEQNFVIPDNHYSQHCLKIRKIRRGELEVEENCSVSEPSDISHNAAVAINTATSHVDVNSPSTSRIRNSMSECSDDDSVSSGEEPERTLSVEVGKEFIIKLDEIFGRTSTYYPDNIFPKINMPVSMLSEINALWLQSLSDQLEENAKQLDIMMEQDQEFARQLAMKEAELLAAGKEQAVPDFKEIMDMDFALNLYQKDVAEWRNNEPNDLAAKMSRVKLHNLFPDILPETLSELLMAHDNNFQSTVEVLLMSTGKTQILETTNGINKFIMEKEMERQEKLLEEEKKALSEVEWPLLPQSDDIDMSVVEGYRKEADKHLNNRNSYYQKAKDYMNRGMTVVANYYSDVASYHKRKYEQANSMAAASLMQVHAKNCSDNATVDLHYLRVGEARVSLDLFLDTHIKKLKEIQGKNGVVCHTLFIITGRGLHSKGKPRVKPAVKKRLRVRNIKYSERNPGLLSVKVYATDLLSDQVF